MGIVYFEGFARLMHLRSFRIMCVCVLIDLQGKATKYSYENVWDKNAVCSCTVEILYILLKFLEYLSLFILCLRVRSLSQPVIVSKVLTEKTEKNISRLFFGEVCFYWQP
jgi:hypothetical protein